jgi:hypothetical protein
MQTQKHEQNSERDLYMQGTNARIKRKKREEILFLMQHPIISLWERETASNLKSAAAAADGETCRRLSQSYILFLLINRPMFICKFFRFWN